MSANLAFVAITAVALVASPSWPHGPCKAAGSPTVLWVGTSLSASFGVPKDSSLTARVQRYAAAAGVEFRLVDLSVPGETLEEAKRRLPKHAEEIVCILVLELGANEALRRLPPRQIERGFRALLATLRALWPDATIFLISTAPSEYVKGSYEGRYAAVFRNLRGYEGMVLADSVMDGIVGNPRLLLYDGLHPNARGLERMASRIWPG